MQKAWVWKSTGIFFLRTCLQVIKLLHTLYLNVKHNKIVESEIKV
jgi:hypothetical protein